MIEIVKAGARRLSDFGWLKTYGLFSFSDYFDPHNIQFSALRVFNDDVPSCKGWGYSRETLKGRKSRSRMRFA